MFDILSLYTLDVHFYSILEDIFVVLMLYSFIKLVLLSSLIELIWPTQFFNRRNCTNVSNFRYRTYTEFFLKLRNNNLNFSKFLIFFKII
jgi:hypothetical protein